MVFSFVLLRPRLSTRSLRDAGSRSDPVPFRDTAPTGSVDRRPSWRSDRLRGAPCGRYAIRLSGADALGRVPEQGVTPGGTDVGLEEVAVLGADVALVEPTARLLAGSADFGQEKDLLLAPGLFGAPAYQRSEGPSAPAATRRGKGWGSPSRASREHAGSGSGRRRRPRRRVSLPVSPKEEDGGLRPRLLHRPGAGRPRREDRRFVGANPATPVRRGRRKKPFNPPRPLSGPPPSRPARAPNHQSANAPRSPAGLPTPSRRTPRTWTRETAL